MDYNINPTLESDADLNSGRASLISNKNLADIQTDTEQN